MICSIGSTPGQSLGSNPGLLPARPGQTRARLDPELVSRSGDSGLFCSVPGWGQLSRQLNSREQELEQAQHESQRQVEALERATREKEALARERAGLAVQLAAAEREGRTLSEEAAHLR